MKWKKNIHVDNQHKSYKERLKGLGMFNQEGEEAMTAECHTEKDQDLFSVIYYAGH